MQLNRRTALTGIGATLLTGLPRVSLATTTYELGSKKITTVSDGNLVLPAEFFFQGLPREELEDILNRNNVSLTELRPPCNVTLMQDGDRTVLFDAGAGSGFMPTAGELVDTLDAIGIAPEDITDVVFTHAHPDHLWGVLDDFDDLVFTEARYMIGRREWDYWRDPDTVNTIGDARASFAVGAARRLEAIEEQCSFFNDGDEVLPGVMARATFGHTPGHMSFELRSGSNALMVVGDSIGNHHVAFERPAWASGADQDSDMGAKTRMALLDQLAHEQTPMIGFHLPGGGMGRVERKDSAYRFVNEDAQ